MKREKISEIISTIDVKYIDEATMYAVDNVHDEHTSHEITAEKQTRRIRWNIVAAYLALFIVIGSTAAALAVEAKEYHAAVAFFESNGLSTDGLSRSEVKAVYRDIATQRFTYGKTAEVIQQAIPGLEIQQDEPTPEELAALWDRNVWMNSLPQIGISYRIDYRYKIHKESELEVLDKSILACFRDGKLFWTVDFTDAYIEDSAYTTDGTAVWGRNTTWSSGWIARVDDEGTVKWTRFLNHGFSDEYIAAVLSTVTAWGRHQSTQL